MLCRMLHALCTHMTSLDLLELTQGLHACFKVLSKIQMPVAYMDMEESQTQEVEAQEESFEYVQVSVCACVRACSGSDKR